MKSAHFVFVLVFVLLACACDRLEKGVITKKTHYKSRTYTEIIPVFSGKVTSFIPVVHHDQERWCVDVIGHISGKQATEEWCMNKQEWEHVKVGNNIVREKE